MMWGRGAVSCLRGNYHPRASLAKRVHLPLSLAHSPPQPRVHPPHPAAEQTEAEAWGVWGWLRDPGVGRGKSFSTCHLQGLVPKVTVCQEAHRKEAQDHRSLREFVWRLLAGCFCLLVSPLGLSLSFALEK